MRPIGGLAAGVTALAVALLGSPALAAGPTGESVRGAEAVWYWMQGDVATSVLIRAVDDRVQTPSASNQRTLGLNVQVFQTYTDPATGEEMDVQLVSEPYYAPATTLTIDQLKGASVRAAVTVTGEKWSETGSGEPQPVGPYHVNVAADWTAGSGVTRTHQNVWDTEFGVKVLTRTSSNSVMALTTGSVTGDLNFGSLGETDGTLIAARFFNLTQGPSMAALSTMLDIALAAGRSSSHVMGAFADWDVGDARSTQILLTVEEDHSAKNGRLAASARLEVIQGYCDIATDELVSSDLFSEPVSLPAGAVDPSIQRASVNASFSVSGFEYRFPSCDQPRWDEGTSSFVGPFSLTVSGAWTATGAITHYRVLYSQRTPDSSSRTRYDSRGRQATATGSAAGSLVSAPLTNVINAFLYDELSLSAG